MGVFIKGLCFGLLERRRLLGDPGDLGDPSDLDDLDMDSLGDMGPDTIESVSLSAILAARRLLMLALCALVFPRDISNAHEGDSQLKNPTAINFNISSMVNITLNTLN